MATGGGARSSGGFVPVGEAVGEVEAADRGPAEAGRVVEADRGAPVAGHREHPAPRAFDVGVRVRAEEAGETPRRLREPAIDLFAERGFHGTGIRDIATAAGTTLSSLYHHFGSKDDLLVDIMFASTEPLRRAAERARAELSTPCERLAMLIEQHVWTHVTDRLAKIVTDTELRALSGERRERVVALRDSYEKLWRITVDEGIAAGVFTAARPKALTIGLLEMCTAVSHWFRASGHLGPRDLCRSYADGGLGLMRATETGRAVRRDDLDIGEPARFLSA